MRGFVIGMEHRTICDVNNIVFLDLAISYTVVLTL